MVCIYCISCFLW